MSLHFAYTLLLTPQVSINAHRPLPRGHLLCRAELLPEGYTYIYIDTMVRWLVEGQVGNSAV